MRWGWSAVLVCAIGALSSRTGYAGDLVSAFPRSVDDALHEWEEASQGLLGVGSMELRRLYEVHQAAYSAHELAVLNEFRGPVAAADLKRRFAWSIERQNESAVMVGRPTDSVEKLFFEQVAVTLDSETRLPKSLQFCHPGREKVGEELAVVPGPRISEPNQFWPAENARPLRVAGNQTPSPRKKNPVRVVEHVTLMPAPKTNLPANVQQVLKAWETSAKEIRSLIAAIDRRVYESGQQIEHRAAGSFQYAFPETVICTLKPVEIAGGQTGSRATLPGTPFELLPSPAEHWEYTPTEIRFFLDPGTKPVVLRRADPNAGLVRLVVDKSWHNGIALEPRMIPPWQELFSVSPTELTERFEIRVNEQLEPVALEFYPKNLDDPGRFQRMRVQFDTGTWLPTVIQFLNWQGDVEEVYTFRYRRIQKADETNAEPNRLPIKHEPAKLLPAPTDLHGNN